MINFNPCSAATAEPHEPLLGSESGLLFGADRVGFDDLRFAARFAAAPRTLHPTRGRVGRRPSQPARALRCRVAVAIRRPGRPAPAQLRAAAQINRKPVPQIQCVTYQPVSRPIGDAQHTAQFGGGKIADGRGAVPTQPDRMLRRRAAGSPRRRRQDAGQPNAQRSEPAGFGGDQGVFVSLRRGQRCGRIQLHQIIFEHAFNILLRSDADLRRPCQPAQATDNTPRIRTTLVR